MKQTFAHARHVLSENPVTMLAAALFALFVAMALFGPTDDPAIWVERIDSALRAVAEPPAGVVELVGAWDWRQDADSARAALRELIEGAMASGTPEEWAARLNAADVPCSNILTLAEAIEMDQLRHRRLLQTVSRPHGELRLAASGFEMAHGSSTIRSLAPRAGEHSAQLLREAGYTDAEIDALAQAGVTSLG